MAEAPKNPTSDTQKVSSSDATKPAGANSSAAEQKVSSQLTGAQAERASSPVSTQSQQPTPAVAIPGMRSSTLTEAQQRDQQAQAQIQEKAQQVSSTDAPTSEKEILERAYSDPSVAREQAQKAVAARIGDPGAAANALNPSNPGDAEASLASARLADQRSRQDQRRLEQENIVKAAPELAQKFTAEQNMAGLTQVKTMLEALQQPENRGVLPPELTGAEDSEPRRIRKSSADRAAAAGGSEDELTYEYEPHPTEKERSSSGSARAGASEQSSESDSARSERR